MKIQFYLMEILSRFVFLNEKKAERLVLTRNLLKINSKLK